MDPKDVAASLAARYKMSPDLAQRVADNLVTAGDFSGYPGVQEDATRAARVRRYQDVSSAVAAGKDVPPEDQRWLHQVHTRAAVHADQKTTPRQQTLRAANQIESGLAGNSGAQAFTHGMDSAVYGLPFYQTNPNTSPRPAQTPARPSERRGLSAPSTSAVVAPQLADHPAFETAKAIMNNLGLDPASASALALQLHGQEQH
jgi:hypothetical protein